jgi:hypothetical protein
VALDPCSPGKKPFIGQYINGDTGQYEILGKGQAIAGGDP